MQSPRPVPLPGTASTAPAAPGLCCLGPIPSPPPRLPPPPEAVSAPPSGSASLCLEGVRGPGGSVPGSQGQHTVNGSSVPPTASPCFLPHPGPPTLQCLSAPSAVGCGSDGRLLAVTPRACFVLRSGSERQHRIGEIPRTEKGPSLSTGYEGSGT